ncbi:efflux RND transporter periplasmic adaptor subunit [Carboxylicivirga linearis]|uniref:Efflux RND transporter periplasmic adaptor subunit n=1 Tax=Carboxylicivirga linearis TaxID=1628157 RepID=A0ABS5JPB4_9BACT|nr:efflux RND transporter periplasmic adaptor subunit [Carboxylicivirga linearis]MBS2096739.1 efflux RND transporter periplasmic adaptor subunit [Carboxylicivirga linearis]
MRNTFLAIATALVLVSCGGKKEADKSQTDVGKKTVKVTTLQLEVIEINEEYTATINAYDKVYLAPNMPGRIKEIKVEVNDKVREGQQVVQMDASQLVQMEVQFSNLEKEMVRMDSLIAYGSISQQVYDQTDAQYRATKASLENLRENTIIKSPFNGLVTGRFYENSEIYGGTPNTNDGKAAILTIEQIEKLKVTVNMSERFFPKVKAGLKTRLTTDVYGKEEFEGTVTLVYPTIDPSTRTFTVEITIPNGNLKLRPGMFARVKVNLGEKETIVAPASAVLMLEGTSNRYVFIEENGKAKHIDVTLGERFDDKLEIISDAIQPGVKLITSGQSKLNNGDLIQVVK